MKRSKDRFLTTHTGSLPRPDDLIRMMYAKEEGVPVDRDALAQRVREAVAEVVRKQTDAGVDLVNDGEYINALGALTGGQAVEMVKAGLKAIYLSGWQVAADANIAGEMYPDQSLYPVNSVPAVVKRINNTFARADQP